DAFENGIQVMERVVIPNHHEDISGPHSQLLGCEIVTRIQIELVEFRMFSSSLSRCPFRYGEDREKDDGEGHARCRRDLFRQKVDHAQCNQSQRDQAKPNGDFYILDLEVKWHPE